MDHFIVSARKYRPATFRSVVGQSHISSTLKNAITRGQLAHAYLFCGPRGVGKTTCARIFAKAINCLSPTEGEACNDCESCRSFNEGRSFNIHELDAASNNSVDDIRNLTEQVRIQPQVGKYSVYIIDEVHMLSLSAFNAFLKTLEEPPAHAVFILATTEKHKIIPTILSRCQIYDFNRIRVEDGVEYLKYIAGCENVAYDEESLHIIAQKADGGMRDALSMFDKVVSFCGNDLTGKEVAETLNVLDYDTYFRVTESILAGNYTDVLLIFDEVLRKGFGGQTFAAGLNSHMRNLLMCKNPQTLPLLEVTGAIADRYLDQSQLCSLPFLFESVDLLTAVDSGFRTATNQRLHVELGLMKLCGMGQKKNVADCKEAEESPKPVLPQPVLPGNAVSATETPVAVVPTAPHTCETTPEPVVPEVQTATPTQSKKHGRPDGEKKPPVDSTILSLSDRSPSLSGFSLKELMTEPEEKNGEMDESADPTDQEDVLEITAEKMEEILQNACAVMAKELLKTRPRIAAAFNGLTFADNHIHFTVPNESIREEIERNTLDLKKRLSEIGNYVYPVEFVIEVTRQVKTDKPVNPEDKLRFLLERNPNLSEFRKALGLDIE